MNIYTQNCMPTSSQPTIELHKSTYIQSLNHSVTHSYIPFFLTLFADRKTKPAIIKPDYATYIFGLFIIYYT